MHNTEFFIRERVRREIPELVDEIKKEAAKKICAEVLNGFVTVQEGVKFDFYLDHFLVLDVKAIIDKEVASYMENPPKPMKNTLHYKRLKNER